MDKPRCVRMWRRNQPEATHHPAEHCCHTALFSRVPPTVNHWPVVRPHLPNEVCGAAPHVILTFMQQINCTCLQENMARFWDRTHEYMHGNRTDFLLGSTWSLPPKMGFTNVYPSVLPFASNSILGSETFYSDVSVEILKFYTPDSTIGIFVTLLLCATITVIAREALEARNKHFGPLLSTVHRTAHFLDACLLYLSEHWQMGSVRFPGYPPLKTLRWLHLTWLWGSFMLYCFASVDLLTLLITNIQSTAYKSVDEVVQRNVSDLIVYYLPQTKLDVWVKSGMVHFQHPFRVSSPLHFYTDTNQVFNVEMRHERSIIIADLDTLELKQVECIAQFGFSTYISQDMNEDNFKYLLTSTTMDATAEKHFRRVYMIFVESGLFVQDVSWDRWKMLLTVNVNHESSRSQSSGEHFEPLELEGFDEFFGFLLVCHVIFVLIFGAYYGWIRYQAKSTAKSCKAPLLTRRHNQRISSGNWLIRSIHSDGRRHVYGHSYPVKHSVWRRA